MLYHALVLAFISLPLVFGQQGPGGAPPPSTFPSATTTVVRASTTTTTSRSGASASTSVITTSGTSTSTAHFPSLSNYPTCVAQCLALASSGSGCNSLVDVNCFCVNPLYPPTFTNCIAQQCLSELPSAEALVQQFCAQANPSTSLSFASIFVPSSASTTSTSPASVSSSTTPASPSKTGGALGRTGIGMGGASGWSWVACVILYVLMAVMR